MDSSSEMQIDSSALVTDFILTNSVSRRSVRDVAEVSACACSRSWADASIRFSAKRSSKTCMRITIQYIRGQTIQNSFRRTYQVQNRMVPAATRILPEHSNTPVATERVAFEPRRQWFEEQFGNSPSWDIVVHCCWWWSCYTTAVSYQTGMASLNPPVASPSHDDAPIVDRKEVSRRRRETGPAVT